MTNEVALDQIREKGGECVTFQVEESESYTCSEASIEEEKDEDYELPETPKRSNNVSRIATPSAPRKPKRADSPLALTHDWLASLRDSDSDLEHVGTEKDQMWRVLYMVDKETGGD